MTDIPFSNWKAQPRTMYLTRVFLHAITFTAPTFLALAAPSTSVSSYDTVVLDVRESDELFTYEAEALEKRQVRSLLSSRKSSKNK